jgi:YHS domain-containing protein
MDIDPKTAAGTSEHESVQYYFCSRGCKMDFDEDPAGVLAAEAAYDHSQGSPMMMEMQMADAPASAAKKPWWKFW